MQNKLVFKVGDKEYAAVRPTARVQQEAQRVYNRAFRQEEQAGAYLREEVDRVLRNRQLWDDEKEARKKELLTALRDGEKSLREGGKKLSEGRNIALKMRRDRLELNDLDSHRSEMDNLTCEGQADNARFDHLVSECVVDNDTGAKVFASLDDYINRKSEEVATKGAGHLMLLLYGLDPQFQSKLPENAFLRERGFANTEGHLIDAQGRLIDASGRLVDSDGRFINDQGEYVNASGERVNEDGSPLVQSQPWLDEEGHPLPEKA